MRRFGDSELLRLIGDGVPVRMRRRRRSRQAPSFSATPAALVDSWECAQLIEAATEAGDVMLAEDRGGRAGIFALSQAMRSLGERRHVVVVAGDSLLLERLWVTGTLQGLDAGDDAVVDWEVTLYRFAARVVTPSRIAADLLKQFGIREEVQVLDIAQPAASLRPSQGPSRIWLPEAQSRRAQTAKILRGLAGTLKASSIVVSADTVVDEVWAGTAMEAHRDVLEILSSRIKVADGVPDGVSLVILGDPFSLPDPAVSRLREQGVPVAVPAGSTVAALWSDAPTWASEEDIAAIVAGETPVRSSTPAIRPRDAMGIGPVVADPQRARRVSVGVPVFRDVRFLDECLESIIGQTQAPDEVLVIDDGSQSYSVDAALAEWASREPKMIRTLKQANRGVCVARNALLEAMTGDTFLLVDADDVLDQTFIEKTATALRANPGLEAVATWTEFFGEYRGVEAKPPFDARVGRRENSIVSTCVLVDMAVRDRGIRFAPDLAFIYCEDWDFWAQIVAAGGKFGLVPEPLARHRVHDASGAHRRTEFAHRIGKARATARLRGL